MRTIVIYNSMTGFTKQYAEWIAKKSGADCCELSVAKKKNVETYDAIIYGGWACAGGISKVKWFKKRIPRWEGKKLIAFCVGGSPIDAPEVSMMLKKIFSEEERKKVCVFYCPGGYRYENMPAMPKLLLKMFIGVLKSKKNKTKEEEARLAMISSSCDMTDEKYIMPILECLGEKNQ